MFVNYTQILTDLQALISANVTGFQLVAMNAGDVLFSFSNMPICDIRLRNDNPQALAGNNYYVRVTVEIEIAAHDLTSRNEAAIIRDGLVNDVRSLLQDNPRFGSYVDATVQGPCEFETGEDLEQGAFVASCVMQIFVDVYSGS